jgi:hypothetical protein
VPGGISLIVKLSWFYFIIFIFSCDHCAFEVKVETPNGLVMGYVKQKYSFEGKRFLYKFSIYFVLRGSAWVPVYHILDANYEPVNIIKGPCYFNN